MDAVVCEGTANELPIRQGCAPAGELTEDLQRRCLLKLSVPLRLAEECRREAAALQIIQGLVARTPQLQ